MIIINLIAADYGDTILIDIEPVNEPTNNTCLLIDCGFNYELSLLPVLRELKKSGKSLDRFIITHYDQDHIEDATCACPLRFFFLRVTLGAACGWYFAKATCR